MMTILMKNKDTCCQLFISIVLPMIFCILRGDDTRGRRGGGGGG